MKTHIKMLLAIAAVATVQAAGANTVNLIVPGTSDPWLAGGGTDYYYGYPGDPANVDVSTGPGNEAPVLAGSVTALTTISWSAGGATANGPTLWGTSPDGGNISQSGNWTYGATLVGGKVDTSSSFSAPIDSLIGVWMGSGLPGGLGEPFYMGSSGSKVVPVGATELFLGSMDGYQWNNNDGAFQVTVTGVPDGGLTAGFLGSALLGLVALRRKLVA